MFNVELITEKTIPALMLNPMLIGEYGKFQADKARDGVIDRLLGVSPSTGLSESIRSVVLCLVDADPKTVSHKPGFWSKFTGSADAGRVRFEVAKGSIETLLANATKEADRVRTIVASIDGLIQQLLEETVFIELHVQAAHQFMASGGRGEDATRQAANGYELETVKERFYRRVLSLQALNLSFSQTIEQLRLLKHQLIDVLDRFDETSQVLLPLWRQSMLALGLQQHATGEQLHRAIHAHETLRKSLASIKQ